MRAEKLSQDYAKAIYETAVEQWLQALKTARDGLQARPELASSLTDSAASVDQKRAWAASVLPEAATPEMENALLLLAQEGRLGLLDGIIAEFEQLIALGGYRPVAHVTTAIVLTDKEQLAMREKLAVQFGTDLEFDFVVDPAILGGVIVRVGGKVVDGSVAGKLRALRDTMGLEQR